MGHRYSRLEEAKFCLPGLQLHFLWAGLSLSVYSTPLWESEKGTQSLQASGLTAWTAEKGAEFQPPDGTSLD